jgi:hypothetical protein
MGRFVAAVIAAELCAIAEKLGSFGKNCHAMSGLCQILKPAADNIEVRHPNQKIITKNHEKTIPKRTLYVGVRLCLL